MLLIPAGQAPHKRIDQEPGPRVRLEMARLAAVAADLEQWRDPDRVVELARLGIAARPGTALDEAEAAVERLGASGRADVIRMPEIGVSSTQIRRRVAQGRPVRYLVPPPVADLIAERGLYREAVPA